jgi:hypothetical protein
MNQQSAREQQQQARIQEIIERELDLANASAQDFIQAIRTALEKGDFYKAQQLSQEAIKHYPDSEHIKNCACVLAPAKITVSPSNPEARKNQAANREWMRANRYNYQNRWVAVRNGQLLATGSSIDELVEQLDDTKDVLLTVIY